MEKLMIRGFFDFLAKMGLSVRDDPPKVIELTGRAWGDTVDGLALSVRQAPNDDSSAVPALSVVLRNVGATPRRLTTPGWLFFFRIDMLGPDGAPASLTPFGRELLRPERNTEKTTVALAPGEATETLLPVGSIFAMRAKGRYRVEASCQPPDAASALRSNSVYLTN
jgi:hypothetical protein